MMQCCFTAHIIVQFTLLSPHYEITSLELLPASLHADVRVTWVPLPKPPDVLILQYKIILETFRTNQSERRLPLETVRHAWNSAAFVSNFSNAWLQNHICKTTTATTLKSKHIKKYLHRILSQWSWVSNDKVDGCRLNIAMTSSCWDIAHSVKQLAVLYCRAFRIHHGSYFHYRVSYRPRFWPSAGDTS